MASWCLHELWGYCCHPSSFVSLLCRQSLWSLCGQERLCFTDVVEVWVLECDGSCYVEEQVKAVPVFLHKGSSPGLCFVSWFNTTVRLLEPFYLITKSWWGKKWCLVLSLLQWLIEVTPCCWASLSTLESWAYSVFVKLAERLKPPLLLLAWI